MDKELGQRAYEEHEVDEWPEQQMPWDRLHPSIKARWARVEAAIEAPHLAEVERLKAKVAELEADRLPLVERCVDAMMTGTLCDKHKAEWLKLYETVGPKKILEILAHCDGCVREERDAVVAKLGESIDIAYNRRPKPTLSATSVAAQMAAMEALKAYHASLTHELPPAPDTSCEANMRMCQECAGNVAIASLMGPRFVCSKCGCAPAGGAGDELPPDLPALGRDRDAPRRPTVDRMDAAPARDEHLDRPEERPGHVCEFPGCAECDKAARERDEKEASK